MIQAVIFDCDGVLVDSEVVAHRIEMEVLAAAGLVYESAAYKARFMGLSEAAWLAALDEDAVARLARPIMAEIGPVLDARWVEAAPAIGAIAGAVQAVTALAARPKAVASSSSAETLARKLKRTGLWDHFAPHVYSADHVTHAKPAPDLFLHAARAIAVAPAQCLVIEDSVNGVMAGLAAGMTVWGFAGGGHMDAAMAARLSDAGAVRVLRDWAEAVKLFAAL